MDERLKEIRHVNATSAGQTGGTTDIKKFRKVLERRGEMVFDATLSIVRKIVEEIRKKHSDTIAHHGEGYGQIAACDEILEKLK